LRIRTAFIPLIALLKISASFMPSSWSSTPKCKTYLLKYDSLKSNSYYITMFLQLMLTTLVSQTVIKAEFLKTIIYIMAFSLNTVKKLK
jgi:hypothetical protein